MNRAIFVSINSIATDKIENKTKTYEFRNYVPKRSFNKLYVYVTSPICELKYIIEIDDIISTPEKIETVGDGNIEFNEGKKSKYAYQINKVYKLECPIKLVDLKNIFKFVPPQSYAYEERYPTLSKYLEESEKKLIWKRNKV